MQNHPFVHTLSRRDFLKTTAVAAMLTGIRSGQAAEKILVGAHPWVYAAKQPNYDITPILNHIFGDVKYAGFDCVELMHTALRAEDSVERINDLKERHELPVIGTSFSGDMWNREKHNEVLEDAELVITNLAKVGGKTLGTSVNKAPEMKTEEQLDAQAELLRKIIKICDTHGVQLNLHNHTYEVENDLHDLKGTLKRIPDAKLGPDLDWLVQAGVDPVWFIQEYGDQIVFLHLRDQKKDKTWVESIGEGDMDFEAIGKALREKNFSGIAVVELAHPANFEKTRSLKESLKMSREHIRKTMGI